jgi:23S rRNA (guanosine2251-2'-O)-methyltransferase
MFIYGKNSVTERIKTNPRTIKQIILIEDFDFKDQLDMIKSKAIHYNIFDKSRFVAISKDRHTQGIMAEVTDYQYADFDGLLNQQQPNQHTFIFLDNLNDPENLGHIIRTAACFGQFAVVIPKNRSVEVPETVLHIASGAENHVPVAKVTNLSQSIITAKEAGYFVAGTVVNDGVSLYESQLPFPLCIIIGSEGKGIRHGLTNHLDLMLTIPMSGAGLSFNAAQATTILCYEIIRQKNKIR